MQFWAIIRIAMRGLLANKSRSFLTMLGVIIGVGSVIAMLAIGEGAKNQVARQFEKLGLTTLSVWPSYKPQGGVRLNETQKLTLDDAEAIRESIPDVVGVAPEIAGTCQIVAGNRNARVRVVGTNAEYMWVRCIDIDRGRMFTQEEDEEVRQYVVIGPELADELFAGEDPVGRYVKINGKAFLVLGVTRPKGDNGFIIVDRNAWVPMQAGLKRVFGEIAGATRALNAIHVRVDAAGEELIPKMKRAEVRLDRLLRDRHLIETEEAPDYKIRNMTEILRQQQENGRIFSLMLAAVAGISLLVGGIGIMNIMMVTVTERTREIGIRKALGAKTWDILKQFVLEAVVISMLGGLAGIAFGLGLARVIPMLHDLWPELPRFETVPTMSSILTSFGFAAAIGVFFGYYPARKAAKLDPIIALRYE
jgi:putative ABC transport system permease protein